MKKVNDSENRRKRHFITITSGLPRSGTSMMMQMLKAGGMLVLTDEIRRPNEDNPKGYYELESIKNVKKDTSLFAEAEGKAVKVISELLSYLPAQYHYKVIFMERELDEVIRSQRKMIIRRKESTEKLNEDLLKRLFRKHLTQIKKWIHEQQNMEALFVNYKQVVMEPELISSRICEHLNENLDLKKMIGVVDKKLYRQRQN